MCVSKVSTNGILYHEPVTIRSEFASKLSNLSRSSTYSETCSSNSSSGCTADLYETSKRVVLPKSIVRRGNDEIRSKYLEKLGIVPDRSLETISNERTVAPHQRRLSTCLVRRESLNVCTTSGDDLYNPRSAHEFGYLNHTKRARPSVSFRPMVEVRLIPHKNLYSQNVKNSIWNNPQELCSNAIRNSIEFAAENFDWRQAVEDEHFVTSPRSGIKVHPAHSRQYRNYFSP